MVKLEGRNAVAAWNMPAEPASSQSVAVATGAPKRSAAASQNVRSSCHDSRACSARAPGPRTAGQGDSKTPPRSVLRSAADAP
jgi:hypothetical protein